MQNLINLKAEIQDEINELHTLEVFEGSQSVIMPLQESLVSKLTQLHYAECEPYRKIIDSFEGKSPNNFQLTSLPFLPVSLFKSLKLTSISDEEIVKSMSSSGTSNQAVSRIYLNKETSLNQTKTLAHIVSSIFGNKRVPMIILDTPNVVKNPNDFSARGAGVLGFSMFASEKVYAFDENFEFDFVGVANFLKKYQNQKIVFFGFTFMIWEFFLSKELNLPRLNIAQQGILLHGGGWKKLESLAISQDSFSEGFKEKSGVISTHDYYGMVEQAGSIYLSCSEGFFHTTQYSTILIRSPENLSVICTWNTPGIIQTISVLPTSYPGHSLLTEDLGTIYGADDCRCGWTGFYFKVHGRIPNVEVRGCSDTFSA
jgi:hypothetical protein